MTDENVVSINSEETKVPGMPEMVKVIKPSLDLLNGRTLLTDSESLDDLARDFANAKMSGTMLKIKSNGETLFLNTDMVCHMFMGEGSIPKTELK